MFYKLIFACIKYDTYYFCNFCVLKVVFKIVTNYLVLWNFHNLSFSARHDDLCSRNEVGDRFVVKSVPWERKVGATWEEIWTLGASRTATRALQRTGSSGSSSSRRRSSSWGMVWSRGRRAEQWGRQAPDRPPRPPAPPHCNTHCNTDTLTSYVLYMQINL